MTDKPHTPSADQTPELPTTEEVRFIYSLDGANYVEPDYREHQAQEFDRWHAAEIAAAKEQAWDEGYRDGHSDGLSDGHSLDNMRDPNENPYRADQMEGDE